MCGSSPAPHAAQTSPPPTADSAHRTPAMTAHAHLEVNILNAWLSPRQTDRHANDSPEGIPHDMPRHDVVCHVLICMQPARQCLSQRLAALWALISTFLAALGCRSCSCSFMLCSCFCISKCSLPRNTSACRPHVFSIAVWALSNAREIQWRVVPLRYAWFQLIQSVVHSPCGKKSLGAK